MAWLLLIRRRAIGLDCPFAAGRNLWW